MTIVEDPQQNNGIPAGGHYKDHFSGIDGPSSPRVLDDGSSVEWPPGFTRAQAASWRRIHNLGVSEQARTSRDENAPFSPLINPTAKHVAFAFALLLIGLVILLVSIHR